MLVILRNDRTTKFNNKHTIQKQSEYTEMYTSSVS